MSYLELLWIPAVLGWLPLIYADEIAARRDRLSTLSNDAGYAPETSSPARPPDTASPVN